MKVEVTLKLILEVEDDNFPISDDSLNDRIEDDLFATLDTESSFQASDDEDYNFQYKSIKVEKIKAK